MAGGRGNARAALGECRRDRRDVLRIAPGDLTVVAITGNGLKTLDVLQGQYEQKQAIRPRMADFEALVEQDLEEKNAVEEVYVR